MIPGWYDGRATRLAHDEADKAWRDLCRWPGVEGSARASTGLSDGEAVVAALKSIAAEMRAMRLHTVAAEQKGRS